jgi:hypothetical protein
VAVQAPEDVIVQTSSRRTILSWTMSAFPVAFAILFILFPVLQPWSGPPEPFVRRHPFSLTGKLIWRGVFLSFALGMLLTAFDPGGRHRPFIVLLVFSGYLQAGEMTADNLWSARMAGMNGNPEHPYGGDVLGWYVIASLALLFLILDRRNWRGTTTEQELPGTLAWCSQQRRPARRVRVRHVGSAARDPAEVPGNGRRVGQ